MLYSIVTALPTGGLISRVLFRFPLLLANDDLVCKQTKHLPLRLQATYYGLDPEVAAWLRDNRILHLFEGFWERLDKETERKRFRIHFTSEKARLLFKMRWL